MKSNTNNVILSEEQFKDIKEKKLENVLKVLPEIRNDIFPVVMDKVSDITKTNIKEYVPTSCLTNSCDKNVKELEEFMRSNNATQSNFIKKRKDEFYKYTRCNSLLNLCNDCLAEEPMYIPRKFRQHSIQTINDREKQLYEKLNLEKLKTETEILTTRTEHFTVKLGSIGNDFNKWLQDK